MMRLRFFLILLILLFSNSYAGLISTSPAITEIIKFLDQEKKLVGVSNYCRTSMSLPKIGSAFQLNFEKVVSLKADYILLNYTRDDQLRKKLVMLNQNVEVFKFDRFLDIKNSFYKLAKILDIKSLKEIDHFFSKFKQIKLKQKKRVLFVLSEKIKNEHIVELRAVGSKTYFIDLIEMLGHKNALSSSSIPYPVLDYEKINELKFDIIVRVEEKLNNKKEILQAWTKTFPKKKIHFLVGNHAVVPGPGILQLYKDLEEVLHD